jgi:aryl-alcohol dehydrogenase-like predicted oxidoreductase
MSQPISRADFCRLSVSGLLGLGACRRTPLPDTQGTSSSAAAAKPAPAPSVPPSAGTMPQRKLGSTGAMVSILGLGGAHIGKKDKLNDAEAIQLMRDAIDGGITFMDNCWDYNEGRSEELMGKALRDGYRQRAFLMTKLDGRTGKAASEQLEQSLKRLQTDVIDLVQIHEVIRANDPLRCFEKNGVVSALQAAKKAGKLRFIGFTGHKHPDFHLAMLAAAREAGFAFDAVQMPLNVMDAHYKSFEKNVLPALERDGIAVLGMKSMGSGDILKSGVVKAEECLRYALSLPTAVVITGIDSRATLDQALALGRNFVPLSVQERESLLARTAPAAKDGVHELFKTADKYDGTAKNPHWLEEARL